MKKLNEFLWAYREARNFRYVSVILAMIVVFITMILLILPAITLTYKTKELDCSYKVHQHTEECYTEIDGHMVAACGYADYVIHKHTEDCYKDDILVCTLPQIPKHGHTESCYNEQKELICGQEELHTHTEKCFDEDGKLICGKQELTEHVHNKSCFTERNMTAEEVSEMNAEEASEAEAEESADVLNDEDGEPSDTDREGGTQKTEIRENKEGTNHKPEEDTGEDIFTTEEEEGAQNDAAENMPAQTFKAETETMAVSVSAKEGAFPAETIMKVKDIKDEKILNVIAVAAKKDKTEVKTIQAVDISFYNADGKEIEPAKPVRVTLSSDIVKKADVPKIIHVDDKGNAEIIRQVNKKETKNATAGDSVVFDADSFSVYGIIGTTIEKNVLASDGHNYRITVTYGEDAGIPDGADLEVSEITEGFSVYGMSYEEYVSYTENVLGMSEGSAEYIRLFDISIMDENGTKVQPAEGSTVDVKIELADAEGDELSVVHFADDGEVGSVVESTTEGNTVSFETDGFSVYAVVDDETTGTYARMTVNFYSTKAVDEENEDGLVSSVIVKNGDTAEKIEKIVYDPGVGGNLTGKEFFRGWFIAGEGEDADSITADTEPKTIAEVREYISNLASSDSIEDGSVLNIYAIILNAYQISYLDELNTVIKSDVIFSKTTESSVDYTVNMSYTPKEQEQNFDGWQVWAGQSNIVLPEGVVPPIANETVVGIKGDVTFSVNAPKGAWLSFNENGKGATYTPPQFVETGSVTIKPDDPTRFGYQFSGWNTAKDGSGETWLTVTYDTSGNATYTNNKFGDTLSIRADLYAQWTPVATANYTVIIWQEKSSDTYAANVAAEDAERTYDFVEAITLSGNVGSTITAVSRSTNDSQRVTDGDGTQYYNAIVNGTTKSYTGYHCASYDTDVTISPEGTSIVNIYYDRNIVTYTFYYPYSSSTYSYIQSNNGIYWKNGDNYDALYFRYINGYYSMVEYPNYSGYPPYTKSGNNYTEYNGVRYTRTGWQQYQYEIGLYGESLNWPTDNGIWWYENGNNGNASGTRMTYKANFIPMDSDMTVEYYGKSDTGNGTVTFYTQDLNDQTAYTERYSVSSSATRFDINDKFTGFYAYQYRYRTTANGNWTNWTNVGTLNSSTGVYGSTVEFGRDLEIRYNRAQNTIAFMYGAYFNGNGTQVDEDNRGELYETDKMFYETDLTSYNEGGSNYYTPTAPAGYAFGGWYADETCTVKYDFDTMPVTGVTVYAKWVQIQYRVFLHPNVPESDTSLVWGQTDQSMNFRITIGDKISGGNMIVGERAEYEIIGWYLDEACTIPFNFDAYVLNDTTVTTEYDKTSHMTDEMNKYGNIVDESSAYNSDVDRFWITKELNLYAKWRSLLEGADGILVEYDAVEGKGNFGEGVYYAYNTYQPKVEGEEAGRILYADSAEAIAHSASTATEEGHEFKYWVLQTWNATVENEDGTTGAYVDTSTHVYPGQDFIVYKANSKIEVIRTKIDEEGKTKILEAKYTVRLRAEYGEPETETLSHIYFYANTVDKTGASITGVTEAAQPKDETTYASIHINQAYDVLSITSVLGGSTLYDGYRFLGWAKMSNATEPWLKLNSDGTTYTVIQDGSTLTGVKKIAADEQEPYEELYAVWEKVYTVTVIKKVDSTIDGDKSTSFSFSSTRNIDSVVTEDTFNLTDSGEKKYENLFPAGSYFSVTETVNSDFDIKVSGKYTDAAGTEHDIEGLTNGSTITIQGDTVITVTNTRKMVDITIKKVDDKGNSLPGATFQLQIKNDKDVYVNNGDKFTIDSTGATYTISLPTGDYKLVETNAPDGYVLQSSGEEFSIDASASSNVITLGTHTDATLDSSDTTGKTLIITNHPGVELPSTGGPGTHLFTIFGSLLIAGAGVLLAVRRRRKA